MEEDRKWRLDILHLGKMSCQKYRIIKTEDHQERVTLPVTALLLRHPRYGTVVYDTGNDDNWRNTYTKMAQEAYPVEECITISEALAAFGLSTADVDYLILSHLHYDHSGGIKYFAGTRAGSRVLISRAGLSYAMLQSLTGHQDAYPRVLYDLPDITYQLIEEETQLFGGLTLFLQESHAPGLIGLQVETENYGTVLAVSDAIYLQESYEKELPPDGPNPANAAGFLENLRKVRERQRSCQAAILYGHDEKQIEIF